MMTVLVVTGDKYLMLPYRDGLKYQICPFGGYNNSWWVALDDII